MILIEVDRNQIISSVLLLESQFWLFSSQSPKGIVIMLIRKVISDKYFCDDGESHENKNGLNYD